MWGGSSFGYRLFTELVPSLTILFAIRWERAWRWQAAVAVAGMLSLYTNTLGAFFAPCGFDTVPNEIHQHTERLWSVQEGEIVRCSSRLADRLESHLQ